MVWWLKHQWVVYNSIPTTAVNSGSAKVENGTEDVIVGIALQKRGSPCIATQNSWLSIWTLDFAATGSWLIHLTKRHTLHVPVGFLPPFSAYIHDGINLIPCCYWHWGVLLGP